MSLNFPVIQSFEDYEQDFVEYVNHYGLDAILSNDMLLSVGVAKRVRCCLLKDPWIHLDKSGLPVVEFKWDEIAERLG